MSTLTIGIIITLAVGTHSSWKYSVMLKCNAIIVLKPYIGTNTLNY